MGTEVKKNTGKYDVKGVIQAIKQFVFKVYHPYFGMTKGRGKNQSHFNADRIKLSTLLVIQHLLITNWNAFFKFSNLSEPSTGGTFQQGLDGRSSSFLVHVFANVI